MQEVLEEDKVRRQIDNERPPQPIRKCLREGNVESLIRLQIQGGQALLIQSLAVKEQVQLVDRELVEQLICKSTQTMAGEKQKSVDSARMITGIHVII
jgi:hypothetical protein